MRCKTCAGGKILFIVQLTLNLLFTNFSVYAEEAPIVVIRDENGHYSQESGKNIAKLEEMITEKGSIDVWITLEPGIVNFAPGLTKEISENQKRSQNERVQVEFTRLIGPLNARKQAIYAPNRVKTQYATSALVRILDARALRYIAQDKSVVIVTYAGT